MIKLMFSIYRDAQTSRAQFQRAVIASAEGLDQIPRLCRYVHRFVSVPFDGGAEAYLELWLSDDRDVETVVEQVLCTQPHQERGAPFRITPLR